MRALSSKGHQLCAVFAPVLRCSKRFSSSISRVALGESNLHAFPQRKDVRRMDPSVVLKDIETRLPSADIAGVTRALLELKSVECDISRNDVSLHALVKHGLDLAKSASTDEILELMRGFAALGLRSPVRDAGKHMIKTLQSCSDLYPFQAAAALTVSGQAQVYHAELFEYLSRNSANLPIPALVTFAYECGRHGLRSKHFVDGNLSTLTKRSVEFDITQLLQVWMGLSRFPRDWTSFFQVTQSRVEAAIHELGGKEIANVLRVVKELRFQPGMVNLQRSACKELLSREEGSADDVPSMDEIVQVLMVLEKQEGFCKEAEMVVQKYLNVFREHWAHHSEFSSRASTSLTLVELIDSLDCFTSYGLSDEVVYKSLFDLFTERSSEIKYSVNVGLWHLVTTCAARVGFAHEGWLKEVLSFSRDRFMLDKISYWQMGSLLQGLVKLGWVETKAVKAILAVAESEISKYKDLERMAEIALPGAHLGSLSGQVLVAPFMKAALQRIAECEGSNENGNKGLSGIRSSATSQLLWAAVVGGLHLDTLNFQVNRALKLLVDWASRGAERIGGIYWSEAAAALQRDRPDLMVGEKFPAFSGNHLNFIEKINLKRASMAVPLPPATSEAGLVVLSPKVKVLPVEKVDALQVAAVESRWGGKTAGDEWHLLTGRTLLRLKEVAGDSSKIEAISAWDDESIEKCAHLTQWSAECL